MILPKPKKIDFSKFLFRASSYGLMMAGTKGISEKQLLKISELEAKALIVKGLGKGDSAKLAKTKDVLVRAELEAKKIAKRGNTPSEVVVLDKLKALRDSPLSLSPGALTYLRKTFREVKYNRRVPLKNKFLDKGNFNEDAAITMIALAKGEWLENNKDRVNSEFFTGEVDMIEGYDAKCSWWLDSFPEKDEPLPPIYEFQNRVYMHLHNAPQWSTIYCLLDIPQHMMEDLLRREAYNGEVTDERKMELFNLYVYTEETMYKFIKFFKVKLEGKAKQIMLDFVHMPEEKRMIEKIVYRDMDIEKLMIEVAALGREELVRLDNL